MSYNFTFRRNKLILSLLLIMKYLFIVLILLCGCATTKYYPQGDNGRTTPYLSGTVNTPNCSLCKKQAWLFKIDSKGRIICDACYRKIKR